MARDQDTDEQRASEDEDLLEMLQGLKIRNSLALQELTSLYGAWSGPARPRTPQLAAPVSRAKLKAYSRGPEFTIPQPFPMMEREAEKRQKMKAQAWADLPEEPSEDDAECLKQFRARPVPAHVFLPMYDEIMEQNEKRRKNAVEKRKEELLSMQKPFQLLVQDRRRHVERPVSAPAEKVPSRRKSIPRSVLDPTISDGLREAEILRKINSHLRAKDLLESSSAPIPLSRVTRDSRTSRKTKEQHLGFLQQNLTFKPHVNESVPDFQTLYRNFQKLSVKNQRMREPTETKPFNLRTSSRSSKRGSKMNTAQEPLQETPPHRSSDHLSSLSLNTLPIYITDSTKRREVAIRSSLQDRDNRNLERDKWLSEQRRRSQTMQSSLSRRARALDPHKPLAVSNKETLKQKRESERRRAREYKEELQEMRRRVKTRAYLFEQVTKRSAVKDMERRFTRTLADAGLDDDFVEQKGREYLERGESQESRHIDEESQ